MTDEALDRAVGVVVPSSNRTVERVTETVFARFVGISACYARIPLWGDARAGGQNPTGYDMPPILEAAGQLAHAKVDLMCWNGTKGASIGFDPDRDLASAVSEVVGVPTVSTALATLEVLEKFNVSRIALIIPGRESLVDQISDEFGKRGIEVVEKGYLGVVDNFACAEVPPSRYAGLIRELAAKDQVEAAVIFNTNARGFSLMAPLEQELGKPVLDSTAIGVWACLHALGIDPKPADDFGRLFRVS